MTSILKLFVGMDLPRSGSRIYYPSIRINRKFVDTFKYPSRTEIHGYFVNLNRFKSPVAGLGYFLICYVIQLVIAKKWLMKSGYWLH